MHGKREPRLRVSIELLGLNLNASFVKELSAFGRFSSFSASETQFMITIRFEGYSLVFMSKRLEK